MDVKTLCLGVLCRGEASGYDIKKTFESAFSHFFAAGYGSIYPALARLHAEGLVDCTETEQERRPDKKIYRVTAAGKIAFMRALMEAEPRETLRSEFLVCMFFAELLTSERVADLLVRQLGHYQERLRYFESVECTSPAVRFTVGYGKALHEAAIRYIEAEGAALVRALARPEPASVRTAAVAATHEEAK